MGDRTAIFVQRRLSGEWAVWRGTTETEDAVPDVGSPWHSGIFHGRGDALCKAHDVAGYLPVVELEDERPPPATLESLRRLIEDDAWAATFQTVAQYRSALLKAASI